MVGGADADDWSIVESHLRQLEEGELTALVTDLWAARGYDAERDGHVVTARDGEKRLRIRVGPVANEDGTRQAADVVVDVTRGTHEGKSVVSAVDLAELLRYAVEPDEARQICNRHLGAPPGELSPPLGTRMQRVIPSSSVAAVAVVGVILLLAAVVGAVISPAVDGSGDDGSQAATDTTTAPPTAPSQSPATPTPTLDRTELSVNESRLPPGVSAGGVTDVEALARAHRAALSNRSYTIRVNRTRSEIRNQELTLVTRAVTIRYDGDEYLARSVEVVDGQRRLLATLYYDGSDAYRLTSGENSSAERVVSTALLTAFPRSPGTLTDRLVRSRLDNTTTRLTGVVEGDGQRLYAISARRDPSAVDESRITRFNATVLVGTDGFVRVTRSNYTYTSAYTLVDERRELVYERVGETTVEPPAWYRERYGDDER